MMKRILAVSDIHGEYDKLLHALEEANYDPKTDQLVLLGDYVDRGPDSKKVVEYLITLVEDGAIALLGNHDKMFIDSIRDIDTYRMWIKNGGGTTIDSYDGDEGLMQAHIRWLDKHLKFYYETDDYIFVHAGLEPGVELEEQDPFVMTWSREVEEIGLGKTVISGHIPVKQVTHIFDRIFIDTGATFGRFLSVLELPSNHVYQA
jgi:serine/threonine protein phosphatase 1